MENISFSILKITPPNSSFQAKNALTPTKKAKNRTRLFRTCPKTQKTVLFALRNVQKRPKIDKIGTTPSKKHQITSKTAFFQNIDFSKKPTILFKNCIKRSKNQYFKNNLKSALKPPKNGSKMGSKMRVKILPLLSFIPGPFWGRLPPL